MPLTTSTYRPYSVSWPSIRPSSTRASPTVLASVLISKVDSTPSRSVVITVNVVLFAPQATRLSTIISTSSIESSFFILISPNKHYFSVTVHAAYKEMVCFVKPTKRIAHHGGGSAQDLHLFPTRTGSLYHLRLRISTVKQNSINIFHSFFLMHRMYGNRWGGFRE